MLQLLAFEFNHLEVVAWLDFEPGLVNDLAFIVFIAYKMNGNA